MFFPKLKALSLQRRTVSAFGGLDLRNAIGAGAFADMKNLCSDAYPLLSARPGRGLVAKTGALGGMIAKDGLCYVNGSEFVINGHPVDMGLTAGQKQLVSMGAYVVIFPDKKYINTLDLTDWGSLEVSNASDGAVQFSLCTADGSSYEGMVTDTKAPTPLTDGKYWLDISGNGCVLRRYSAAAENWVEITTTYVCIRAQGIGAGLAQYDGVTVSGIAAQALQSLNGSAVISARGEDHIVIPGILNQAVTQDPDQGAVTVERRVPDMDFVIESENRLWGCRYGFDRSGSIVNELYACKLGDFKNWQCFQGLSTDSYRVSLGADGAFTGAVTHLGYPLFFRENCLHKVYGSYPAAYKVQTTTCRGVRQGCGKSLAIVEGVLYYLGSGGICAYDGSLPEVVSAALGQKRFHGGVAGALGSKYYISMTDEADKTGLFVFDTARNLWHREDDLQAVFFCTRGDQLFCHDGQAVWDLTGTGEPEGQVPWMAQTGHLDAADPNRRYISRITARLEMEPGSVVRFYARYDGRPGWEALGTVSGRGLGSFSLPLRVRRCESLELRLEGTGPAKLYSLTITGEKGSDRL